MTDTEVWNYFWVFLVFFVSVFIKDHLFFYIHEFLLCVSLHQLSIMPMEGRRWYQIACNQSYE